MEHCKGVPLNLAGAGIEVRVRDAEREDVRRVVAVHKLAFPGFLMTLLGDAFLEDYYSLVHSDPDGVLLVAECHERIVGFVAGYLHPLQFYRALRRHRGRLVLDMLPALCRQPILCFRVLDSFFQTDPKEKAERSGFSELASLGVEPAYKGQGIGTRLVQAFLKRAEQYGAHGVYLTTDAHQNDAVNRFYVKLGFVHVRTFRRGRNRLMNEYCFPLREGARL